jgi:hypothetical protein
VKVVEEAIKYIDELHMALLKRAPFFAGRFNATTDLPPDVVEPLEFVTRMFHESFAGSSSHEAAPSGAAAVTSTTATFIPYNKRPSTASVLRPLQSSNYVNVTAGNS